MNSKNVVTKSKNVTYYVNREKKTVVAVIECDALTPLYILDKVFDKFENGNGNHNLLEMSFDNYHVKNVLIMSVMLELPSVMRAILLMKNLVRSWHWLGQKLRRQMRYIVISPKLLNSLTI